MEKLKGVKKVIFPIVVLIVMIGAIVIATVGFNFGLMYASHKRVEIYLDTDYSVNDLTNIVKEVVPNEKISTQKIETFNKDIAFNVKNISDEQIQNLKDKIKEKYKIDGSIDDTVVVKSEPHTRMRDIMKPYVKPLIVTSILIFVYLIIRFRKLGLLKVGLLTAIYIIAIQALYYSILAICRIPISKITMPIALLVYILTIITLTMELGKMNKEENLS